MQRLSYILQLTIIGAMIIACNRSPEIKKPYDGLLIDHLNQSINEAVIEDGFSPPVASRIYAYCNIAAYEAYFLKDSTKKDLSKILNSYTPLPEELQKTTYDRELGTYVAFCEIALEKVYRDFLIDTLYSEGLTYFKSKLDRKTYNNSIRTGKAIAQHVIDYSSADNYKQTRSMPLWEISRIPGTWEPTPPMYGTAIEPHWGKLRTFFVISDKDSVTLPDPIPFDSTKGSQFFNLNLEVYNVVNNITKEQEETALYWDGDPTPPQRIKHIILIRRQLNPVGHWLAMGSILNKKTNKDEGESIYTYLSVSVACADVLIACWKFKFLTDMVRPQTYITRYIDKKWDPVLATPPFPEYPSGHSSIAGACSAVMINIFSDTIPFLDNSKVRFGFKERSFNNISEAALECAESRVYGGVHLTTTAKESVVLGRKVGDIVNRKFSSNAYLGGM